MADRHDADAFGSPGIVGTVCPDRQGEGRVYCMGLPLDNWLWKHPRVQQIISAYDLDAAVFDGCIWSAFHIRCEQRQAHQETLDVDDRLSISGAVVRGQRLPRTANAHRARPYTGRGHGAHRLLHKADVLTHP